MFTDIENISVIGADDIRYIGESDVRVNPCFQSFFYDECGWILTNVIQIGTAVFYRCFADTKHRPDLPIPIPIKPAPIDDPLISMFILPYGECSGPAWIEYSLNTAGVVVVSLLSLWTSKYPAFPSFFLSLGKPSFSFFFDFYPR